jgi:hypothetical protein
MIGRNTEQQLLSSRKAFLISALVYVLNFVLGTAIALQLNLSDPGIGGTSREHWFTSGTPFAAPGGFMILYVILLALATRPHWIGSVGIVGVLLLSLISGFSLIPDMAMLLRAIEHHLSILTALTVALLFITIPVIVILGIMTLILQARTRARAVMPQ